MHLFYEIWSILAVNLNNANNFRRIITVEYQRWGWSSLVFHQIDSCFVFEDSQPVFASWTARAPWQIPITSQKKYLNKKFCYNFNIMAISRILQKNKFVEVLICIWHYLVSFSYNHTWLLLFLRALIFIEDRKVYFFEILTMRGIEGSAATIFTELKKVRVALY